jgi:zinc protease
MRGTGARAFVLALILFGGIAGLPACNIAPDPDQFALELLPIPDSLEVAVRVLLKVGAAEDPTGKDGLCCLTWRMLSEGGSRLRSLEDLAGAFDLDAAGFSLRLEKEVAVFSAVVRKNDLASFCAVFRDILLDPGFRQDDFDRLKAEQMYFVRTALAGNMDEQFGPEVLNLSLYQDHPYGRTDAGTVETVEGLTLEDVKAFYREHFVRGNIVIGLAGGYSADFPAKVRSDFEKLPAGFTPRLPLPRPRTLQGLEFILVEKATATPAISIGFPIGRTKSKKAAWALRIAAAHFNEAADNASAGWADFVEPTLARRQKNFSVRIRPNPSDNIHFLIRRTLRELRSVAENGLSDERFQSLRTALLGLLDRDASSPETRLIRQMSVRNDGFDFSANAREILAGLTLKDVNKTIQKYLRIENGAIVVIAPGAAELRDALLSNAPSPNANAGSTSGDDSLSEDAAIRTYTLAVKPENIRIIPAGEFFLKPGMPGLGTPPAERK